MALVLLTGPAMMEGAVVRARAATVRPEADTAPSSQGPAVAGPGSDTP